MIQPIKAFQEIHIDHMNTAILARFASPSFLCFLQTPTFPTDALASRILFPINRVKSLERNERVCQPRRANKNKARPEFRPGT